MLSKNLYIQALIGLLKVYQVKKYILCPGSRNAPIIESIASQEEFSCIGKIDERSAGFFALGCSDASNGEAIGIVCTSGSALLNLAPSIAEAYYRHRPLIVISADRPQERINQNDNQTIPQAYLLNSITIASVNIIESMETDIYRMNIRNLSWAFSKLISENKGPIHINIPLREPLFEFEEKKLTAIKAIDFSPREIFLEASTRLSLQSQLNKADSILLLFGQGCEEFIEKNKNLIKKFLSIYSTTIALSEFTSDHRSNEVFPYPLFDQLLASIDDDISKKLSPQIVISFGHQFVSKRLKNFLQKTNTQHWCVTQEEYPIDTFMHLVRHIQLNDKRFFEEMLHNCHTLKNTNIKNENYRKIFSHYYHFIKDIRPNYSDALSDIVAIYPLLLSSHPHHLHIILGNSSVVRNAFTYEFKAKSIFCNRGTAGIEGSLSTAMGFLSEMPSEDELRIFIGDLSYFYDLNALYNFKEINKKCRIILFNNSGGQIFYSLPGLDKARYRDKYIAAQQEKITGSIWAKQNHFHTIEVKSIEELNKVSETLNNPLAPKLLFIEIWTDKNHNLNALQNYYQTLKNKISI